MMQSISLIISFFVECIVLIYYTNSTLQVRKSKLLANSGIIIGYIFLYIISLLYSPSVNLAAFLIVNFILLYLFFRIRLKNAAIESIILMAVMMLAEGVMFMFTNMGVYKNSLLEVSLSARVIHAVLSKLIYFIGVVINKYISKDKSNYDTTEGFVSLIIIPVFTGAAIMGIMSIFESINEKYRLIFAAISVFGIASNIIVYWIYDKTLLYHKELRELQEQKYRSDLELAYCNMLEEKLSNVRILRHDFKEHLRILETYIKSDNSQAMEYLKSIEMRNDEASGVNYTNNKVLNILLSEKQKICLKKGITYKIHASEIKLDFMKDIDIVSVFSNLLNNAIESCDKSERKTIYVSLYEMNSSFLVIKIENSCDEKPIENNGFYKTTKISNGEHGIGLKSVVRALKNYDGDLRMQYDAKDQNFTAMIMIPLK